jgi:LmbE family N-acetylglucosaminyl deacetylase
MEKVLCLSPHIDDVELAMGGTLIRHRDEGDSIVIAVLNSDDDLVGDVKIRIEEQNKSELMLRATNTLFFKKGDSVESKIYSLDTVEATIVYFPFELDSHQDHVVAAQIGFSVARRVKRALQYISTTSRFCWPNHIQVINMEKKKELVSLFKSQIDRRPKFMEIMEAQNRYFGSLIPGNGYFAEGFHLVRMVMM